MAYMAPEVVDERRPGYSWQVDWWSLGVCVYELLWHRRPFDGNSAEKMRDSILTHPIRKPSHRHGAVSNECTAALFGVSHVSGQMVARLIHDWISQLLERDPKKRLGCRTGSPSIDEIRSQPWFSQINWAKLEAKLLDPPFVPDVSPLSLFPKSRY
jgi:serine/threonine kinase 32